jgi:DNA-binding SARP family transcriptional activator
MRIAAICLSLLFWLSPAQAEVGDPLNYVNLGLKSSSTNKKIKYFTKALELNPALVGVYERRGLLYFFREEYDKVIRDFEKYLDLGPAKAEAFRMLGLGYLKSGIYHPAIASFARAIEMEPQCAAAYSYRAEAYRLSENYEEAISDSTKAIQLGGDQRAQAEAHLTRAKVYWEKGYKDLAAEDIIAFWQNDPSVARLGGLYTSLGPVVFGIQCLLIAGIRFKPDLKTDSLRGIRILRSKLLSPQVSETIRRERLLFLMSNTLKRRLTTVVAGAGYGKSTLIEQASRYFRWNAVWYRLEKSDKEFGAFLNYLLAGICQVFPDFGVETLSRLEATKSLKQEQETILTIFLSELEEIVIDNLIIILDDYHTVQDDQEIGRTIEFLLTNLPSLVHLVLSSRTEIDLPLSRLKARREVIEITENDIAFTTYEIAELFSRVFDISLDRGNLEIIHQKTGGWVSGLILFCHSLREKTSDNIESIISNLQGTPEVVLCYLEENVYELLAEDTKDFLIKTSILNRITAPFCDRLLNIDCSAEILKDLARAHLFISAVDEQGSRYYYHQLFQEFLQIKLAKELDIKELVEFYKNAAGLLEEAGENEELLNQYPLAILIEEPLDPSPFSKAPSRHVGEMPKPAPRGLKIHLLGKFKLFVGDQEISAKRWKSRKARTLFQFLLYSRSRGYVNKEVLMELLWPEEDPQKTAKRLHVALASLRKTLQPDLERGTPSSYISRDNDSYTIDVGEEGWVDIENFVKELHLARQEKDLGKSIAHYLNAELIYKGDFLEEDPYSDWCIEAREGFKSEYLQLLGEIIEYYDGRRDYKQCIKYANKYLKFDKYAEDIYQLLMTYYANTGNKAMVVKTFENCSDILENDLNCPISNETKKLYQKLIVS